MLAIVEAAGEAERWVGLLSTFGVPAALLFYFLHRGAPLIRSLVESHIAFVKAMEEQGKRCNDGMEEVGRVQQAWRDEYRADMSAIKARIGQQ